MRSRPVIAVACLLLLLAGAAPRETPTPADPYRVIRGMTISCPGAGRIWGSDAMVESMTELRGMGVNWIAIHPYASISADGTVGGSRMDGMYADATWLTRPIAEAHRLGLKIMIKPHLAYWGSPFSWRGAIAFEDDAQWQRFFDSYERWITMVAAVTRDADAFVVGTELDATINHEQRWRRIIAAVRSRTGAPLTYSANWDSFERVGFWDALDAIGIQGYFPLVTEPGLPSPEALDRAWRRLVQRLDRYGAERGRDVVLAELGYNRSDQAAVRPWEHRQGGADAEEIQRRCLAAALKALDAPDRVCGAFLWKWFPGGGDRHHGRGNFLMSTPAMREIIRDNWTPK